MTGVPLKLLAVVAAIGGVLLSAATLSDAAGPGARQNMLASRLPVQRPVYEIFVTDGPTKKVSTLHIPPNALCRLVMKDGQWSCLEGDIFNYPSRGFSITDPQFHQPTLEAYSGNVPGESRGIIVFDRLGDAQYIAEARQNVLVVTMLSNAVLTPPKALPAGGFATITLAIKGSGLPAILDVPLGKACALAFVDSEWKCTSFCDFSASGSGFALLPNGQYQAFKKRRVMFTGPPKDALAAIYVAPTATKNVKMETSEDGSVQVLYEYAISMTRHPKKIIPRPPSPKQNRRSIRGKFGY